MREYRWDEGRYLCDYHNWFMLLDIPKLAREDTGEYVMLQPPKWVTISGLHTVPEVECKIYFVPEANIYIAIGEKANGFHDVLFYDLISADYECRRRYPDVYWDDEED